MRRAVAAVVLAAVVGACGGGGSRLADDLLLVTRVLEVSPVAVRFVGRDVAGNVSDVGNTAEPRVLIYEVDAADARILDPFPGAAPPPATIRFGRDSLSVMSLDLMAEDADRLLLLLRPLLDPTRGGVGFEALAVALDSSGRVVASDWSGDDAARLEAVLGDDPAASLAALVGAVARWVKGDPLSERDRELLETAGVG